LVASWTGTSIARYAIATFASIEKLNIQKNSIASMGLVGAVLVWRGYGSANNYPLAELRACPRGRWSLPNTARPELIVEPCNGTFCPVLGFWRRAKNPEVFFTRVTWITMSRCRSDR
jgi:hypothetical protein